MPKSSAPLTHARANTLRPRNQRVPSALALPQIMLHRPALFLLLAHVSCVHPDTRFAEELEECIRNHAIKAAAEFPKWGNACLPPTRKVDIQAKIYEETLAPFYEKHGYQAALWCAMYSLGMTGAEYNPNDTQPNNPNFADWYQKLMCPWNLDECGHSDDLLSDNELQGVPVCPWDDIGNPWKCAPNQHPQYPIWPADQYVKDEADRKTMSCALCGRLKRTFPTGPPVGAPAKVKEAVGVEYSLEGVPKSDHHLYTANWDLHPFGSWLANDAAAHNHASPRSVDEIVQNILVWRASNGEEIHGYLWQSVRLLAYDSGTLEGTRFAEPSDIIGINHVLKVCKPFWWHSPQSRDDCAHAAGHGYFYYFLDIGRAAKACWSDQIVLHTPGPEEDTDFYTRMAGLSAADMLKWRWLCVTGVYHSAGNTLSPEVLSELVSIDQTATEFLCKHSNLWGDEDRYFGLCAAGLGIKETEARLEQVRDGVCQPAKQPNGDPMPPAKWEIRQLKQFGDAQQLSCNPASLATGFTVASSQCPLAFRAHFPCTKGTLDYQFCTGAKGGADVKKDGHIVPYHKLCVSHAAFRRIFECVDPMPHRQGTNKMMFALEWEVDHPAEPMPHNVINWVMGTPIGVWGGSCTCPDGRVYQAKPYDTHVLFDCRQFSTRSLFQVADEGNLCGSVACVGGVQGHCNEGEGEWSFRKVICAPAVAQRQPALNVVTEGDETVGVWGGTCTCPDGEVYLVGDQNDLCGSLACEGGEPGLCNHYVSLWQHRRVTCYNGLLSPPSPPSWPPQLPSPTPPRLPPSIAQHKKAKKMMSREQQKQAGQGVPTASVNGSTYNDSKVLSDQLLAHSDSVGISAESSPGVPAESAGAVSAREASIARTNTQSYHTASIAFLIVFGCFLGAAVAVGAKFSQGCGQGQVDEDMEDDNCEISGEEDSLRKSTSHSAGGPRQLQPSWRATTRKKDFRSLAHVPETHSGTVV